MNTDIWHDVLHDLRLQMTSATFDTWLANSHLVEHSDGRLVVAVRNAYAVDWLQYRLYDVVNRVVTAVTGQTHEIVFQVDKVEDSAPADDLTLRHPPAAPVFPGFEPIRSNFTQMPRQFFEVVLRSESPVVTAFVAAVVDQTYGVIINYHTGERREWWEASYPEIGRVCGLNSMASVGKALKTSRANGYVVRSDGTREFRYRLRRIGEPLDDPIKK
ncbi:MAG: hypothetical protein IAE79_17940 [Anaerolinea sp.]|nr:hypothetical protein [Anaerolinea sp.]